MSRRPLHEVVKARLERSEGEGRRGRDGEMQRNKSLWEFYRLECANQTCSLTPASYLHVESLLMYIVMYIYSRVGLFFFSSKLVTSVRTVAHEIILR